MPRGDSRGRRRFAMEMEARRASETSEEFKAVRRGWYLGGKAFREELLEQIEEERREWHGGAELAESDEQRAQRMIEQALKKKRCTADGLRRLSKGNPFKIQLAEQLRKETTMTLKWIAEHLYMGTRGHLAHLLYWHRRSEKK